MKRESKFDRDLRRLDHTLILKAFINGLVQWRPFVNSKTTGELCFDGLCWVVNLDSDGVPALSELAREKLGEFVGNAAKGVERG